MTDRPSLFLKRREEHRLRQGHPWVFSNEVDTQKSPMSQFVAGGIAQVRSQSGKMLGIAQVNPKALICARLLARGEDAALEDDWIERRIGRAQSLRERMFDEPCYRLVYAESDGLPGLVVDRYGAVLAVQFNSAGMDAQRERVLDALRAGLAPTAIVIRNDNYSRALEGLPNEGATVDGALPEMVEINENGARFQVDVIGGQKTGWFYDQRQNRARAAAYTRGARVLDLFSYGGGFGIQCALAGAKEVLCIDSSESAISAVARNATLNGVSGVVRTERADVFDALRVLRGDNEKFDLVIADPPAFIRRKKDHRAGVEAYRRLNRQALQVLSDDGILLSASCSSHLDEAELLECVRTAASRTGRIAQLLERGGQALDHPLLPGMPESDYLKALVTRCYRA